LLVILVVGATGLLGAEVCRRLSARGHPMRALVRPGSPRESALRALDASIVHGDLKDPASLDAACRGASVVITTANSMMSRRGGDSLESVDRDGSLSLLQSAVAAGTQRFIYTSASPALPANNPLIRYKREVESALRASALRWTILQPTAFMEVHAGAAAGWDFRAGRARLMGSGRAPIAYVSVADVAAIAVQVVENPRTEGRDLHITGPEPLSALEAVAIAERVTGRQFTVQRLPTPALHVLRALLRPFNPVLATLLAMGIGQEEPGERATKPELFAELGIRPTTFEEYVRRAIGQATSSS
jgi:uncharacterized protein YbjT (DUF2867 family)